MCRVCTAIAAAAMLWMYSANAHADACAGGDDDAFLKGNTHLHSRASGDASASLDEIARWYSEADYDFVVVTDHNEVTEPRKDRELLVIPGVELTRNPGRCKPAPPERGGKCRLHVNGLFVDPDEELDWDRTRSRRRLDIYGRQLDAVDDIDGLAQLNHPTWHHGMTGELLAELAARGMRFVEIANAQFTEWNAGDEDYPSTEQVWDGALTRGATVWAIASDDAHHFDGDGRYPPGGGFVMVRADRDVESIRAAMAAGDFYASTGVVLDRVDVDPDRITVGASGGDVTVRWIGDGGRVLRTDRGRCAAFDLDDAPDDISYVRAVVTDGDGAKAWLQPVRPGSAALAHERDPVQ